MRLFNDLYKYRELLNNNVKKEIRGKYKGAWLGILWSYLNPLLMMLVYSFVFKVVMKIDIPNYTVYLMTGLIPWNFFTTSVSQSATSIIVNGGIMKKVYFPREIIPISTVTANLVNFLISCLIILVFLFASGVGISIYILFFPLVLFIQYILQIAIAFIVSSITVYARDLEHIIGVLLMAGFYATPIVYSMEMLPPKFKILLSLNPVAHLITAYRDILFAKKMPNLKMLGIVFLASLLLLYIGYLIFKRLERKFVEEL